MPPATPKSEGKTGGRGALFLLGFVIVLIQLLILFQLTQHTTVIDVRASSALDETKMSMSITSNEQKKPNIVSSSASQSLLKRDDRKPDGTLNGIPIYHYPGDETTHSTVSCVGENYQPNAYMYRSCHFTHFCFDTEKKDFVLFQSPEQQEWSRHVSNNPDLGTSSAMSNNMTVALGGLNPKWKQQTFPRLQWFPEILPLSALSADGFYQLPPNYVWVPFHSFAGFNAGHIIWDDFLPIYTLLEMFGLLEETGLQPFLTRNVLKGDPLWATCDLRDENKKRCAALFNKFLPAMRVDPATFSTTTDISSQPHGKQQSKYVCSVHGAAGIAQLTDHGTKAHGWEPTDYESTHNMGRGPMIYKFRNYMLSSLNIPIEPLSSRQAPYNVVFSRFSSQSGKRRTGFDKQLEAVQKEFSPNEFQALGKEMKSLSLYDQAKLASETAIWITSCGGGAVTAMLLPRGASVIIYYDPKGSLVRNRPTNTPARLDWDLFNHMSHLRVHWFPTTDMNSPESLMLLNELIRSELHVIEHQSLAAKAIVARR